MALKVIAEAAFNAKAAIVWRRRALSGRGYLNDPAVLDVYIHLAADAAVCTGGAHFFEIITSALETPLFFKERSNRTYADTLSTEDTIRIFISQTKRRADRRSRSSSGIIEHLIDLYFVTGPHTQAAQYALVHIPNDHLVGLFVFLNSLRHVKTGNIDAERIDKILQHALPAAFAGNAIMVPLCKQQLYSQFTRL